MQGRLPSMMGMRAFEAVARHLSFTRAALELNLSQTAVSHQIRSLETILGGKLFTRGRHKVSLTEMAADYLPVVRSALTAVQASTDLMASRNSADILTVQCLGTFAVKRLLPVLHSFQAANPAIVLRLSTVQAFLATPPYGFDLAIWHGNGDWPALSCERLEEETVFPVCSPRLLGRSGKLDLRELGRQTIIRTRSPILQDEWPFWLQAAGLKLTDLRLVLTSDYLITSMQAAIDGLGLALARSSVVLPDLASGALAEPFSIRVPSNFAYHLVIPDCTLALPKVRIFRDWFMATVARPAGCHEGFSSSRRFRTRPQWPG